MSLWSSYLADMSNMTAMREANHSPSFDLAFDFLRTINRLHGSSVRIFTGMQVAIYLD